MLPTEIWDPTTETWSPAADDRRHARLPLDRGADARRTRAGGRRRPRQPRLRSPASLSADLLPAVSVQGPAADDHLAPRPRPPTARTSTVSTPDAASISAVNLVSLGSDTHQSDMDQHFVPLSFTQGDGLAYRPGAGLRQLRAPRQLHAVHRQRQRRPVGRIDHPHADLDHRARPPRAMCRATANSGGAQVTWTAPDDGGSPITSYTVTPYIGSAAQTPTTVNGPSPPTKRHDQRPHQRRLLHVHGDGHQLHRDQPGICALGDGDPGVQPHADVCPAGLGSRRQRHHPGGHPRLGRGCGRPARGRGRRVELEFALCPERHRLGRRHVHRAACTSGPPTTPR